MDFADKALIALSDDNTRLPLFGQTALKNIVKAAYGLPDVILQGDAEPRFAAFTLGGLEPECEDVSGGPSSPEMRIDALWRGDVRISAKFPRSLVETVKYGSLSLADLDVAVAAASGGAMPVGPALENARRAELVKRLELLVQHSGSATPEIIENWLRAAGTSSVAEFMAATNIASLSEFQIAFSPPIGGDDFTQMDFPVAVAVLIRDPADPGMRLTSMVAAARRLQAAMRKAGFEPKQPSEAAGLGKAVTALLVPENWFEDADWPGADEDERITAAGAWMAREGIALVPAAL